MKIGERTFGAADQDAFARISADRNPMHMDAVAARRLVTGRQVVHGIHILLAAIEYWQNVSGEPSPVSIGCTFSSPVSVGDKVTFTQSRRSEHEVTIDAAVNGVPCTQVTIATAGAESRERSDLDSAACASGTEEYVAGGLTRPLAEPAQSHLGRRYTVQPGEADVSMRFPRSCEHIGRERVAAVCALSYFVGMVCPGLHSIFSSLSIDMKPVSDDVGSLEFQVRKYDSRVGLFEISFHGRIDGTLKAFVRPPPQVQPRLAEMSRHIAPGEFRGTRSLIIGGSRGLGEITAKILAAGGGDVILTYVSGADDARTISEEINSAGESTCETVRFDVMMDAPAAMNVDCGRLTAVYFFATPRIFRRKAVTFERSLFREFYLFYVEKFHELCTYLEANAGTRTINVFFPSSIAVAERPRGMTEYSMAKAAAEILIQDINRACRNVSITCVRLPRLNTDQTATVLRVASESNLETIIPIVRSMQNQAGS